MSGTITPVDVDILQLTRIATAIRTAMGTGVNAVDTACRLTMTPRGVQSAMRAREYLGLAFVEVVQAIDAITPPPAEPQP